MTARMIVPAPTQDADSTVHGAGTPRGEHWGTAGWGPLPGTSSIFLSSGAYQEELRITIGTLVRIINCMNKEDHLDRILAWESGLGFRGDDGVTPT